MASFAGTADDPLNLPPHLAEIAERDFGETPATRATALTELRARIAALPEKDRLDDVSDANLIRFLRNRKYVMDRVVETTVTYARFKKEYPHLFDITEDEANMVLESNSWNLVFCGAPHYHVALTFIAKRIIHNYTADFVKAHPDFIYRFQVWVMERVSREPAVQVCGAASVYSFKDFGIADNLSLGRVMNMKLERVLFPFIQNGIGIKIKGIYLVEVPALVRGLAAVLRLFMSSKTKSRFHVGGSDFTELHKNHFEGQLDLLPPCFDGTGPEQTSWLRNEVEKEFPPGDKKTST